MNARTFNRMSEALGEVREYMERKHMTEAKHTPGPWTAGKYVVTGNSGDDGNVVCEAPQGAALLSKPRWDANALLIAAAPDLLAACEDCLNDRGDWVPLMYAAIEKARGR